MNFATAATAVVAVLATAGGALADTVITDFNAADLGAYNPRENWFAFGAGTTDRGVHADGSSGRGAYHAVDWGSATWGVGNVASTAIDLTAYTGIRIDARVVGLVNHTGTARLRFALDVPGSGEWTTPSVALSSAYETYEFNFSSLTGSGALDLANSQPKWVVEKNGQSGSARFDFDEITGVGGGSGGPYALSPVTLRPPPDGDDVRAMWLYAGSTFSSAAASQAVLDFCGREGVNRIYLGGYGIWANGSDELKDNLRTFLATANASGIQVDALLDGTDWQDYPVLAQTRIDQILTFQRATATPVDDFQAIHFDIEFWLDGTWNPNGPEADRQQIARNYLDNVLINARAHLDAMSAPAMTIGVDLSAHLEAALPSTFVHGGVTQRFLEHVLDHADDVVLMSYIDSAAGLVSWTGYELDLAAGKGRRIQLGADIHFTPPEVPINTFADDGPTAFAAMTMALEEFHGLLSPARLGALAGFSVFHYDSYAWFEPSPRNLADLDGDGDADGSDLASFAALSAGPAVGADGLARDVDFDGDGDADLYDFAFFARCFTGAGVTGPLADECLR